VKLSKRLETILSLVPSCECLADIGTDHAYIPIEAVTLGIAKRAIASDIGEGPIIFARSHIADAALADIIDTRVGDGLSTITPGEADVIVIAGMGGQLISDIIRKGIGKLGQATLILSPQSELDIVRAMLLSGFGYVILAERAVYDDGKYYFIIKAVPAEIAANFGLSRETYSSVELEFGKRQMFDEESILVREELIKNKIKTYDEIMDRLRAAGDGSDSRDKAYRDFEQAKEKLLMLLD